MALSDPPIYHIGIVVSDLEAAKAHLSELLGITWGNEMHLEVNAARDADGNDVEVPFHLCYSREEPHIELVQEVPGTIWVRNEHSNLHHLGVWSDAVPGDSAALAANRCPLSIAGRLGDVAPAQWVYHRDELGFNIELVDSATKEQSQQYMCGSPRCTMSVGSLFHVGVVVPSLEDARDHLRDLFHLTWGPIGALDIAKRDAEGNDLTLPLRMCYSAGDAKGSPRIELIEEIPGSVWECNEHSNLHHIGFWSDALVDDIGALNAARCPMQLSGRDGDVAPVQSAYHWDPLGVRVELVNIEMRSMMEQFMFRMPDA